MSLPDVMKTEVLCLLCLEEGLVEGFGTLARRAQDERLGRALLDYREDERGRLLLLAEACEGRGWRALEARCEMLWGVQAPARRALDGAPASPQADALVVATVQKALHLEIASCGSLRALAYRAGETSLARRFEDGLYSAKAMDARLTEMAEGGLNQRAAIAPEPIGTRR